MLCLPSLRWPPPVLGSATEIGAGLFTVNWTAVSGATGYRLDVATDKAFTSLVTGYDDLACTGTSQAVDTGAAGTYYYRLRATDGVRTSPYSRWASLIANTVPDMITDVSATDGTYSDKVRVTWSAAPGTTSKVYRSETDTFSGADDLGTQTSPFDDATVVAGTTYYYWVTPVNEMGEGTESASDAGYATTHTMVFTVTVAGDVDARGDYWQSGTYAGYPTYENANGWVVNACNSATYWQMASMFHDPANSGDGYYLLISEPLNSDQWGVQAGEMEPAPVVTML